MLAIRDNDKREQTGIQILHGVICTALMCENRELKTEYYNRDFTLDFITELTS